MALVNKIIVGYVIQVFDTDLQQFTHQEFTSSEDEAEYERAEDGESVEDEMITRELAKDLPIILVPPDKIGLYFAWLREENTR